MKKQTKGFITGFIVACLMVLPLTAFADSIQAYFNSVNISVDGTKVANQNENYKLSDGTAIPFSISYKGTTYIPIRKVSELLGIGIEYDHNAKEVKIGKSVAQVPTTPVDTATPETVTPEVGSESTTPQDYEQKVVDLVNQERNAAGLGQVTVNQKLSDIAKKKAEDMRDNNYFAHNSPTYGSAFDMIKKSGINYKSAGENIAKGQENPKSVMDGWMNSPGHKTNILNDSFTEIGVAYITDNNGDTYWVQMFITQ